MANAPGALELLPSHLYPAKWLRVERDWGIGMVETVLALPEKDDPYHDIYMQRDAWWRMVDPALLDPANITGNTKRGHDPGLAWNTYLERMKGVQFFHKNNLSYDNYHKSSHYFYGRKVKTFATVRWRLPPEAVLFSRDEIRKARPGQGNGEGVGEIQITWADAMTGKVVDGNMHFGTEWRIPAVLQDPDGLGDGTVPIESGQAPGVTVPHGIAPDGHGLDHADAYKDILCQVYTLLAICKLAGAPDPS